MPDLSVMEDGSEIVYYNDAGIPIYVNKAKLSAFPNMAALCHWHDDIEYIHPVTGHMTYYVNGKKILIKEKDALLVNTRQMHYGFSDDRTDCFFHCILFKLDLLGANKLLQEKYVFPLTGPASFTELYLNSGIPAQNHMIQLFELIYDLYQRKEPGYELEACSMLFKIWKELFLLAGAVSQELDPAAMEQLELLKKMLSFIYQNYPQALTLGDIARSGGVCKNKCCQVFRRYLQKSPIQFLNTYRLESGMKLLRHSSLSVSEIAFSCGFNSPSYFSEMFIRQKGCSPTAYRESTRE